jgi:PAS domain S-box-containing protein
MLIAVLLLLFACVAVAIDLNDRFHALTSSLEAREIDNLVVPFFLSGFAWAWFARRRAGELRAEIAEHKRTGAALQESEARYRALVEGSIQGICIHRDAVVHFANQALATIFGYDSPAALIGRDIWLLGAPHEWGHLAGNGHTHRPDALVPTRYEWQGRCRDGTLIWVESLASQLVWNGQPAFLLTVVDITEGKRQEQVQQQIAYEIHDGIAQLLVSAHQHLETCEVLWQADKAQADHHLERSLDRLQRAIVETRQLMARLRPPSLETVGLIPAMQQYLEEVAQETGWEVEFTADTGDLALPPDKETAIFRIFQEALTNAQKHAGTPKISVALTRVGLRSHTLSLVIKDWGKGFDLDTRLSRLYRYGTLGMRERARMLGGSCSIESASGQGTTVVVHLPLQPNGPA